MNARRSSRADKAALKAIQRVGREIRAPAIARRAADRIDGSCAGRKGEAESDSWGSAQCRVCTSPVAVCSRVDRRLSIEGGTSVVNVFYIVQHMSALTVPARPMTAVDDKSPNVEENSRAPASGLPTSERYTMALRAPVSTLSSACQSWCICESDADTGSATRTLAKRKGSGEIAPARSPKASSESRYSTRPPALRVPLVARTADTTPGRGSRSSAMVHDRNVAASSEAEHDKPGVGLYPSICGSEDKSSPTSIGKATAQEAQVRVLENSEDLKACVL